MRVAAPTVLFLAVLLSVNMCTAHEASHSSKCAAVFRFLNNDPFERLLQFRFDSPRAGHIAFSDETHYVRWREIYYIELTETENSLLRTLVEAEKLLTYEEIRQRAWPDKTNLHNPVGLIRVVKSKITKKFRAADPNFDDIQAHPFGSYYWAPLMRRQEIIFGQLRLVSTTLEVFWGATRFILPRQEFFMIRELAQASGGPLPLQSLYRGELNDPVNQRKLVRVLQSKINRKFFPYLGDWLITSRLRAGLLELNPEIFKPTFSDVAD